MKKRLMVGLLAGGLLAATASPALAGPPTLSMGCPDDFAPKGVAPGWGPDRNGNGQVCLKAIQGGSPPIGMPPLITPTVVTDDHPKGPSLG